MATTTQTTALIGVFPNRSRAEHFVRELKQAGFRDDQIGVLTPREEEQETPVEDSALAGALTGGTLGGLAGLALTAGLLPGVGPVLAGGILTGLLGGVAAGATAGGVLGALIGLGVPEEHARRYEAEFRAGRTLVVVQGEERFGVALAILRRLEEEDKAPAQGAPAQPELEKLDQLG
jgi:hypothetical protein